jgi:hypothetical protein
MNFTSAVSSTDEEAVDTLFGAKTPGADNLLGGEKKKNEDTPAPDDKGKKKLPTAVALKDGEAQEKADALDEAQVVDDLFGGEDQELDEYGNKVDKKPAAVEKKSAASTQEFEVDYKALYEQMVKDGVWQELDIPDDIEWNADTFKKAQQLQTSTQYQDLLDKTGPYGKAIIEFEKNGGNPGEMLNLFREQRQVQEFDIKEADGQEEFLRAYYEAQGNSEASTNRMVKALLDQGPEAFSEEAQEKKQLWDAQYAKEIEGRQKEQQLMAKTMETAAKNFQKTISDTLTADAEVTPKERKELGSYILSYDKDYQGKQVSQFYVDMSEIQKDPANYVELAKFIKGLKNGDYKKKVENKVKREVTASTFMKVKGGGALSRSGGETSGEDGGGSNFVSLLKRK